ncbi:MAG: hypothetical protein K2W95_30015 [Candidatus Obscuribacterales bacterium]|nr:hypothetical protein [Candidatus Obscuribacterales bacterium]
MQYQICPRCKFKVSASKQMCSTCGMQITASRRTAEPVAPAKKLQTTVTRGESQPSNSFWRNFFGIAPSATSDAET